MNASAPVDVDILIVGAGPVGLFGAYYAGFRALRVAVMDSLPELGGQISAMYPEKQILDVAGPFQVFVRAAELFVQEHPARKAPYNVVLAS